MGKVTDSKGIYCEALSDIAEDTFFNCDRWLAERNALREQISDIAPSNIIRKLLEREYSGNSIKQYIEKVLRKKKIDLDSVQHSEAAQIETQEDEPIAGKLATNMVSPDLGEYNWSFTDAVLDPLEVI